MRQTAARLNRTWLTVLGVVLLLAGLTGIVISTGLLGPLARRAGLGLDRPRPEQHVVGAAATSAFALTWVVLLTALAAVVVALLGLAWLIAQIPRANQAKPFRLHDDAQTGLTRVEAGVLGDAVEAQARALPGVTAASAVVRGTTARPELTLSVTANDRADLAGLLDRLQHQVGGDLGVALDTRLHRLGVQLEISAARTSKDHISV
ncbi:MAG: hypothetical protein ACRYG2_05850 [Janthinobacterium lividum]